jgi:hypothetical protein
MKPDLSTLVHICMEHKVKAQPLLSFLCLFTAHFPYPYIKNLEIKNIECISVLKGKVKVNCPCA